MKRKERGRQATADRRALIFRTLLDVLPDGVAEEVTAALGFGEGEVADVTEHSVQAVVTTLLDPSETRAACRSLGKTVPAGGRGGAAGPLLRALLLFPSFGEARRIAHDEALRGRTDWLRFVLGRMPGRATPPRQLPLAPDLVYAGREFSGWDDFLWSDQPIAGAPKRPGFWPFSSARAFVRSRGLVGQNEWFAFARGDLSSAVGLRPSGIPFTPPRPADVPAVPSRSYAKDGWTSWGDFLGTGEISTRNRAFRSFAQARRLARGLGLRGRKEWQAWIAGRLHRSVAPTKDLPSSPQRTYLDAGWVGWGDFLGTGNLHARDRKFCTYVEVREFARGLPVRTATGWRVFCRGEIEGWSRPPDVPANPERYFRDRGWHSWREFFGTGDPGSG